MTKFYDDLKEGQKLEDLILEWILPKYPKSKRVSIKEYDIDTFESLTIETKLDKRSQTTLNIAIEYSFRGSPSGIETTTADWWVQGFHDKEWKIACAPLAVWKELCKNPLVTQRPGGDGYETMNHIIPKEEMYKIEAIKIYPMPRKKRAVG